MARTGTDAQSFRGVPLTTATPTDGQAYIYDQATNTFDLGTAGGGGITSVNGDTGPAVSIDLDSVLTEGYVSDLPINIGGGADTEQLVVKANASQSADIVSIIDSVDDPIYELNQNSAFSPVSTTERIYAGDVLVQTQIVGNALDAPTVKVEAFDISTAEPVPYALAPTGDILGLGLYKTLAADTRNGINIDNENSTIDMYGRIWDFSDVTFTGGGLDDMTVDTSLLFTGQNTTSYSVTIDGVDRLVIGYDTLAGGVFAPGDIINGQTSSGKGTVVTDNGFRLLIDIISPGFIVGEVIDNTPSGGTTTANILALATVDTMTRTDGTTTENNVVIDPFGNDLSYGVRVLWGSPLGHTVSDNRTFDVTPQADSFFSYNGLTRVILTGDHATFMGIDMAAGRVLFRTGGTNTLTLQDAPSNGKVGINNTDPQTALDVGIGTQKWAPMIAIGDSTPTPVAYDLTNHSDYFWVTSGSSGPVEITLPDVTADPGYLDGVRFEFSTDGDQTDVVNLSGFDGSQRIYFKGSALTTVQLNNGSIGTYVVIQTGQHNLWFMTFIPNYIPLDASTSFDLQTVTDNGNTTTNAIAIAGGTTPSLSLEVQSGTIGLGITTTTTPGTTTLVNNSSHTQVFNSTSGDAVCELPPAVNIGEEYLIMQMVNFTKLTITPDGTDTINGSTSDLILNGIAYVGYKLICTATGRWIAQYITKSASSSPVTYVTASTYTPSIFGETMVVDTTGGACTINLPDVANCDGSIYNVKKISNDVNTVTIDPNGSQFIDYAATKVISVFLQNVQFQGSTTTPTQWFIL